MTMTHPETSEGDGQKLSLRTSCARPRGPSASDSEPSNLVELLGRRAARRPDSTAYTFLLDGEAGEISVTYGRLDERARALGAWLQSAGAEGQRVLLLYPPGIDYIVALFGCLYAGALAVPAYPPRRNRNFQRLQALAADAGATFALTTAQNLPLVRAFIEASAPLKAVRSFATDALTDGGAGEWREPSLSADGLALLQYTSGSTGDPKGVMLSHRNLLHNSKLLAHAFAYDETSHCVSWLPPYHDMGLIGGLLQPLYGGYPCTLMSPVSFLQRPAGWLEAISRHRSVISGGPDFAYQLCLRKIGPEQRAALDLSGWSVAFNGAEPIRAETLEEFSSAFAPAGFRREAFFTCYGLAESTLIVSGGHARAATVRRVEAKALEKHRWVEARDGEGVETRALVGCGPTLLDQRVRIVNPDTLTPCAPDEVGEIWVAGPSVAEGYWGNGAETGRTFGARLADTGEGPFLRTGDLGRLGDGELFITGRAKDLIIIRGLNHYPHDIERTAGRSHAALGAHPGAAFSVEAGGEERLVVVHEVGRRGQHDADEIIEALRRGVAENHEVEVHAVVLIKQSSLPKTSSGKVQRRACRAAYLEGRLEAVKGWRTTDGPRAPETKTQAETPADAAAVRAWLVGYLAAHLDLEPSLVDVTRPVTHYGLDSLKAIELVHAVQTALGVNLPFADFLQSESIDQLAAVISARSAASGTPAAQPPGEARDANSGWQAASRGQQALLFLNGLAPESPAYNITGIARVLSEVDAPALRRAAQSLVDRHPSLRATFAATDEGFRQFVHERQEVSFRQEDASGRSDEDFTRRLAEESRRPFDLENGPLFRVSLFARSEREQVILLAAHHVIADFWSMTLLVADLGALYRAETTGRPADLPALTSHYSDYARAEAESLSGAEGERLWSYWRGQLAGPLPTLRLPADRPRPSAQTCGGASRGFLLDPGVAGRLKAIAREQNTTLYTILLAAFKVLLHRYTGQGEIIVGSPAANREAAGSASVVGYFANLLPLRSRLGDNPTFREFLEQVRLTVLDALRHQSYPFAQLVERLQPERDLSYSPLFQAAFVLQRAPDSGAGGLAEFTLGEGGAQLDWAGLRLESVALEERVVQFDLTLSMAETAQGLKGSFEYRTDLFDPTTVDRIARNFQTLLESIVGDAGRRLDELSLLSPPERERLAAWNDTRLDFPDAGLVHEQFERQAAARPAATALRAASASLSYAELNGRANQLAHFLGPLPPDSLVAVLMQRTPALFVSLLAVLKAGAAYLPLDPALPARRLAAMLADARPARILTQHSLLHLVPPALAPLALCPEELQGDISRCPDSNPNLPVSPRHAAYAIYTSGSTGRPKAVVVEHRGLANLCHWHQTRYAVTPADRATQLAGLGFDAAVWELWPYLTAGASVEVVDEDTRLDPARLAAWLTEREITLSFLPTPLAEGLLGLGGWPRASKLRALLTGGDRLHRYAPAWLGCEVVNHYGPTESSVVATCGAVEPEAEAGARVAAGLGPSIGGPVGNTQVYVLDGRGGPAPVGVAGEFYVGGMGLARGYLHEAGMTAERFVPDALSGEAGARLYRTGDLVRRMGDGRVEFVGRADGQVKVRGQRVELGEVEVVLGGHDGVRECAVVACGGNVQRLVAFVVGEVAAGAGGLRRYLKELVPEYMVPSEFVKLEEMPLTVNGKVDRQTLAKWAEERAREEWKGEDESGFERREWTATEEMVAGVWAEVLGVEAVGAADNFFDLGGHSLLATQIASRLRRVLGVEVPLRTLFESPTVAALAARIDQSRLDESGLTVPPVGLSPRVGALPLSYAQQRLWFLEQFAPGSAAYHIPAAVRLGGFLDVGAMARTFTEIVRRHESLRTTFETLEDQPVQVVHEPSAFDLPVVDLGALPAREREAEAARLTKFEAERPFSLSEGPLMRACVLRLQAEEHVLLLGMHHIVSDGWSLGVLIREVAALYDAYASGRAPSLRDLPVQYADYAVWQREWLREEVLDAQLSYWKRQLSGSPSVLELPTDRLRPPTQTYAGATESLTLRVPLLRSLKKLGQEEGATLFMTLLAAFQVLLSRYTGGSDIPVGTPLAGRSREETEDLIGFFVNTLVLRARVGVDQSFRQILGHVREVCWEAYAHQDVPFELLVEHLQPAREMSHTPLFQVAFAMQNASHGALELRGLSLSTLPAAENTAKFDLTLTVSATEDTFAASLNYNTDLFDAGTITGMLEHYHLLLENICGNPERSVAEIPLITEMERLRLASWNNTRQELPRRLCVHEQFERQAAARPAAPALRAASASLSYAELNGRANQLAHFLRPLPPDSLVAVLMQRTPALFVSLLAVLKAGAAYLPLDPALPARRLAAMLADARPARILTQHSLLHLVPPALAPLALCPEELQGDISRCPDSNPNLPVSPRHAAYAIYTSGSTGRPKAVVVEHRGLANLCHWHRTRYAVTPADRATQLAGLGFDAAVWELWPYLTAGASVEVVDEDTRLDPARLADWLTEREITLSFLPTPLAESLLGLGGWPRASKLRALLTGGDRLHRYAPAWLGCEVVNHYGPTESSVVATCGAVEPEAEAGARIAAGLGPSIGGPVGNTQVYVLDASAGQVPVGVAGELYVGGMGLARGYLHEAGMTAERFVPDALSGEAGGRLYRTGDLVRRMGDGRVEFVGRADGQVKVRGQRVELGEVEVVLGGHDGVRECAVVACGGRTQRLVAFVVAEGEASGKELRGYLRERIPEHMVPSEFVLVAEMPLTTNGKVNRVELTARARDGAGRRAEERTGGGRWKTATEEMVAGVWAEVLGVEAVGPADNFFELGGHSLLATQIASRLRSVFRVEFPLRALFESPTVASLSEVLDRAIKEEQGLSLPPIAPREREGDPPLSFAQQRLWFLEHLQRGSSTYQIPAAARLTGALNVNALGRSFDEIIRRHETLRTSFATVEGRPVQIISPEARPLSISVTDVGHLSAAEQEAAVAATASEEALLPFELSQSPLMRARLLRLSPTEHVLFFTMHHIVSDAWSVGVLIREMSALYEGFDRGLAPALPDLRIQYADYSMWQQQWLQGGALDGQADYWRRQLAGRLPVLDLPTAYPRPPVQTFRGARQAFALSPDLTEGLKALSRAEGGTLFMTLLAAFQTLLHRYSGQDDLVVGTVVANRNHLESEELIGYFINALALRTDLSGEPSFRQLLGRVREVALGAYAHQDLPFEKLVEDLQPERDVSRAPLFQVMLVLQNTPHETLALPGLSLELVDIDSETSKLDVTLMLTETEQGLAGWFEYKTDLFDGASIRRLAGHFKTLLQAVASNPDQPISELPLLTPQERPRLTFGREGTKAARPHEPESDISPAGPPARAPQKPAVVVGERRVSHDQLNHDAERLAAALVEQGAAPALPVALGLEDDFELLLSALAVLKAGGIYLLPDARGPAALIRQSLEQGGCAVVLPSDESRAALSGLMAGETSAAPARLITLDALAARAPDGGETPHGESRPAAGLLPREVTIYVLDRKLNPAPFGVAGEVCLEAGGRLHQTGLPGRLLPDGDLRLLNPAGAAGPDVGGEAAGAFAFVAPRTPTEEAVAEIWRQVLGRPQIGVYEKFFEVGGDSLKVVRVVIMLDQLFPKALTVVDLFKYNTVASISEYVDVSFLSRGAEPAIQGFEL